MRTERRWGRVAKLQDALWMAAASIAMGSFIAVAHFQDFRPPLVLGVGEAILSVSLGVGALLGLLSSRDDISIVIARSFVASIGAFIFIVLTVFAPVLAGVVPDLGFLGGGQLVRASLLTSIFILPLNLLGSVFGSILGEWLRASSRGVKRDSLPEE
ncbi:MAG: hypothetical protein ACE5IB_01985 [Candidatus Geothermarchaeales archaeon]